MALVLVCKTTTHHLTDHITLTTVRTNILTLRNESFYVVLLDIAKKMHILGNCEFLYFSSLSSSTPALFTNTTFPQKESYKDTQKNE